MTAKRSAVRLEADARASALSVAAVTAVLGRLPVPGEFAGRCCDQLFTDHAAWIAHQRAEHKRTPYRPPTGPARSVRLNAGESELLGARVWLPDTGETLWTVWAQHPSYARWWLVNDRGEWAHAQRSDMRTPDVLEVTQR